MAPSTLRIPNDQAVGVKEKALQWAERHFDHCCLLDHNDYERYPYHSVQALLAAGNRRQLQCSAREDPFARWKAWQNDAWWSFGFLAYDLKNALEDLQSRHPDGIGMPDLFFFEPELVLEVLDDDLLIHSAEKDPAAIWRAIRREEISGAPRPRAKPLYFRPRMSKPVYVQRLEAILGHIQAGDVYEMNFCQEFFAEAASLRPVPLFRRLNASARAPFSAFLKLEDRYLFSTSPERFLKRSGSLLLSQPIKGTARRSPNAERDARLRRSLQESLKDRTENVMIVDLVRNDLGRCCRPGSVRVEELFGLYTFEHVHQLISTVSGQLRTDLHPVDAIRALFPMGSMTGAPKVRSMQLIERYELSRRGLYSGALGYFRPGGDFDFNVIIRSLLYHASRRYASI
jgi:para-aminobenzoate synthetase component 1